MRASTILILLGLAFGVVAVKTGCFIAFAIPATYCVVFGALTLSDPVLVPAEEPQPSLEEEADQLRIPVGVS